jgi:hypothetical protein
MSFENWVYMGINICITPWNNLTLENPCKTLLEFQIKSRCTMHSVGGRAIHTMKHTIIIGNIPTTGLD